MHSNPVQLSASSYFRSKITGNHKNVADLKESAWL
jgi:hypothetical protein